MRVLPEPTRWGRKLQKAGKIMELDRKPLLRVAVVSDIQGYAAEYDWGMHNAEKAFRLLASKQPDVLILGGDIADGAMEDAFIYCRQLIDRCFTGKVPVPVACAGNHDYGLGSAGNDHIGFT